MQIPIPKRRVLLVTVRCKPGRIISRRPLVVVRGRWLQATPSREISLSRIVVLGAGAIGGLTVAHLTRAGEDVVVVDPWFQNVNEINRRGLHITRPGDDFVAQ